MIYVVALIAAIVGAGIAGFAGGSLVGEIFVRLAKGPGDGGGNAMSGFFIGAPFAAVAGLLLSFGGVVRMGGGNHGIASGALVLGGIVLAAGVAVVLFSVVEYKLR